MRTFFTKLLLFTLVFCLVIPSLGYAATPSDYNSANPGGLEAGNLYSRSAILINADTGEVLFEKDADSRRYPASTTKIMTCILGLESDLMGTTVTIPNGVTVSSDSSKMGITIGEHILFDDLLYGMMLASGNDAALAVAILVSGTSAEFVKLMNAKAQELGTVQTHYTNPHGLHEVNHYTTARDLAIITQYAMKNETFRDIVACTEKNIVSSFWPEGRTFTTKYDLLLPTSKLYYPSCTGVKTGYTKAAGRCFVGSAQKNGITFISVCLNPQKIDENDKTYIEAFTDTIRLFDYGFSNYSGFSFYDLYNKCDDSLLSFKVAKAATDDTNNGYLRISVSDIPSSYTEWYLNSDIENPSSLKSITESFASRVEFEFNDGTLSAPITRGDVLGKAYFTAISGEVLTGTIVASRDVAEKVLTADELWAEKLNSLPKWVQALIPGINPLAWIIYIILVAVIAVVVNRRVKKVRRRNRQRRAEYERRKREYLKKKKHEEYLRKHPEARRK